MPSYGSGTVEAAMTHRMTKDCLWLQHFISNHYSAYIGGKRYVECPSTAYAKDLIGNNMFKAYSGERAKHCGR